MMSTMRLLRALPVLFFLLVAEGCRGGAAARAAPLPQPTNIAQWLAIAVFVIGVWWVVLKILRG